MSSQVASMPFPARLRTELQLDRVLLGLVLALLLGGFVILASASISISDNLADNPFFYKIRPNLDTMRSTVKCDPLLKRR